MGRLPKYYRDRPILYRIPYDIPGTLIVPAGAIGRDFPADTFKHNQPKPFEIHRVLIKLTTLDANSVVTLAQPAAGLLERLVWVSEFYDPKRKAAFIQAPHLVSTLMAGIGPGGEQSWEWAEPYYLSRGQGLRVKIDNAVVAATAVNLRAELTLQGFKIVVGPPNKEVV